VTKGLVGCRQRIPTVGITDDVSGPDQAIQLAALGQPKECLA
jgi:hypothetical protein